MSEATQVQHQDSDKKHKLYLQVALRKDRRWRRFEPGNRHNQTNADAWYAAMSCRWESFERSIAALHAIPGREREAQRLRRNIIGRRRSAGTADKATSRK